MTAICNIATVARPTSSGLSFILAVIVTGLQKVARALKHRRDAGLLAGMDDRMLSDIGLTRSDLHDAYAEPLWRDPTDVLAGRASERRRYRRAGLVTRLIDTPSVVPDTTSPSPSADLPARHPS